MVCQSPCTLFKPSYHTVCLQQREAKEMEREDSKDIGVVLGLKKKP